MPLRVHGGEGIESDSPGIVLTQNGSDGLSVRQHSLPVGVDLGAALQGNGEGFGPGGVKVVLIVPDLPGGEAGGFQGVGQGQRYRGGVMGCITVGAAGEHIVLQRHVFAVLDADALGIGQTAGFRQAVFIGLLGPGLILIHRGQVVKDHRPGGRRSSRKLPCIAIIRPFAAHLALAKLQGYAFVAGAKAVFPVAPVLGDAQGVGLGLVGQGARGGVPGAYIPRHAVDCPVFDFVRCVLAAAVFGQTGNGHGLRAFRVGNKGQCVEIPPGLLAHPGLQGDLEAVGPQVQRVIAVVPLLGDGQACGRKHVAQLTGDGVLAAFGQHHRVSRQIMLRRGYLLYAVEIGCAVVIPLGQALPRSSIERFGQGSRAGLSEAVYPCFGVAVCPGCLLVGGCGQPPLQLHGDAAESVLQVLVMVGIVDSPDLDDAGAQRIQRIGQGLVITVGLIRAGGAVPGEDIILLGGFLYPVLVGHGRAVDPGIGGEIVIGENPAASDGLHVRNIRPVGAVGGILQGQGDVCGAQTAGILLVLPLLFHLKAGDVGCIHHAGGGFAALHGQGVAGHSVQRCIAVDAAACVAQGQIGEGLRPVCRVQGAFLFAQAGHHRPGVIGVIGRLVYLKGLVAQRKGNLLRRGEAEAADPLRGIAPFFGHCDLRGAEAVGQGIRQRVGIRNVRAERIAADGFLLHAVGVGAACAVHGGKMEEVSCPEIARGKDGGHGLTVLCGDGLGKGSADGAHQRHGEAVRPQPEAVALIIPDFLRG